MVVADLNSNGKIDQTTNSATNEVLQETHYYPFGMRFDGPWAESTLGMENKYRYNGKELIGDMGLNWYAYGARYYDPAIGRFTGVDPIADQFAHLSVYNYASNDPIKNVDLHGLQGVHHSMVDGEGTPSSRGENTFFKFNVSGLQVEDTADKTTACIGPLIVQTGLQIENCNFEYGKV